MKLQVSIEEFGAKADGTLQTGAIQAAIDHCFLQGGGVVTIPAGVYLTGGIRLRSHVTLYLQKNAVLKGVRDPEAYFGYLQDEIEPLSADEITDAPYIGLWKIHGETAYDENDSRYRFKRLPGSRWNNALIRAIDAENVAIIGEEGSLIDGDNCFDEQGEEKFRGPHAIGFFRVKGIKLEGYTVQNSANWAHHLLFCENISVGNVKVEAGHDGFDASVCKNLTITDCEFYSGDDCIAGFGNVNVFVENCLLNSSCSAFRFGGTNVYIRNCKAYAPGKYSFRGGLTKEEKQAGIMATADKARNNMLSFFTYYADYSVPIPQEPGNIVIESCDVRGADRLLHYNFSGNETWQRYRPLRDITFRDVTATDIGMALNLYGTADKKVQLTMENVSVAMRPEAEVAELVRACNYDRISLLNLEVKGFTGECLIRSKGIGPVEYADIRSPLAECDYRMETQEDFAIKKI